MSRTQKPILAGIFTAADVGNRNALNLVVSHERISHSNCIFSPGLNSKGVEGIKIYRNGTYYCNCNLLVLL